MPLVKCPDCKKDISTRARSCPNCGRPRMSLPWGRVVVGLILISLILGLGAYYVSYVRNIMPR